MSKHSYPELTRAGSIGGLKLPHRMLMGSMHLGIEGDRTVLDRLIAFYLERVRGGAALIMTGGAAVHPSGIEGNMFCLTQSAHRQDLETVVGAVHRIEGKLGLQLFHAGRYTRSRESGMTPWAPSAVASSLTREVPLAMTAGEISELIAAYRGAARFAAEAGFDAVEIMASEGYLLNQFLSPGANLRTDAYGGLDGALSLISEIVSSVRSELSPSVPLIVRMSGMDLMPSAYTLSQVQQVAIHLANLGIDAINVGVGWHESKIPTVGQRVPPGAFSEVAASIRQVASIPIIAANRIAHHDLANLLIQQGKLDFVAPARAWLADPEWASKALGKVGERPINPCIACNQACLDHVFDHPPQPAGCMVNPRALNETRFPRSVPALRHKQLAVVGAGPSGLAAAVACAEKGYRVTLFESADDIGGQLRWAKAIPWKHEFEGTLAYYRSELIRLHVNLRCGTRPAAEMLIHFDGVILATGTRPRIPEIPGVDLPSTLTYAEALESADRLSGSPILIGGGGIGVDLALFFAQKSRSIDGTDQFWREFGLAARRQDLPPVTLLARGDRIGMGIGRSTRWVVMDALQKLGVAVQTRAEVRRITEHGVVIRQEGNERQLDADFTVLCTGQEPNQSLFSELADRVPVHLVGGARSTESLDAVRAFREGFEVAWQL